MLTNEERQHLTVLLVEEKAARQELIQLIDTILKEKEPIEFFAVIAEQALEAVKEYVKANGELADIVRQLVLTDITRNKNDEKAPDTQRNI